MSGVTVMTASPCVVTNHLARFARGSALPLGAGRMTLARNHPSSHSSQGAFGVCFGEDNDVLSVRPNARLWSADPANGDVIATLNFQETLTAESLAPKYSCLPSVPSDRATGWEGYVSDASAAPEAAAPALNFTLLSRVQPYLLLSWSDTALFLLDLSSIEVAAWYDGLKDVRTVAVSDRGVFFLNDGARRLTCLSVRDVPGGRWGARAAATVVVRAVLTCGTSALGTASLATERVWLVVACHCS